MSDEWARFLGALQACDAELERSAGTSEVEVASAVEHFRTLAGYASEIEKRSSAIVDRVAIGLTRCLV